MKSNLSDLTHIYRFTLGSHQIDVPFEKKEGSVKRTVIFEDKDREVVLSEYKNGYKVMQESFFTTGQIIYRMNYPLKEIGPNQFEVVVPL